MLRAGRRRLQGLTRSPAVAAALVALLVGASLIGLRALGTLEGLELAAYDWLLRLRPPAGPDRRIALVTISERDIQEQGGWPLPDGPLAELLATVARHRPRVVGVDIYRDVPVPPDTARLDAALAADDRVIAVMKFGDGPGSGIPAPAVLRATDRVGFNDVLVDPGGIVRRGLLFLDDGTTTWPSFALVIALRYLADQGVAPAPDPGHPAHLRLGRATIRPFESHDGAYVGADARGYQFLLDFGAASEGFAKVSLTDLLSGRADAALEGKIVLIGVTAESVKDNFYTPYSRGLTTGQHTAGIEIHAYIISQLLRLALDGARPLRALADWQEALVVLVASAAGGGLGLMVRVPWRLLLGVGAGVLALGGFDYLALLRAWWLPFVPPTLGWVGSAAIVTAYLAYHEKAERTVLMKLFSRHVSKEVAEAIWRARDQFLDGGRPRSQRHTVTALFTDLTGFTTVAERLPPERLMEWLNEQMEAMAGEVSRHGGVIRQYAGDSIVALFGVPVPRRSETEVGADATNAVDCALGMEAALRELNRRWLAEGRPTTGMRIGIFTGPVVAGSLGSAERSEYVVVGDTVNTASRLESFDKTFLAPDPATQPCRILVGEPTLAYLGDRYQTEWVGEVSLQGKTKPVRIHRVIGRAPGPLAGQGDST